MNDIIINGCQLSTEEVEVFEETLKLRTADLLIDPGFDEYYVETALRQLGGILGCMEKKEKA